MGRNLPNRILSNLIYIYKLYTNLYNISWTFNSFLSTRQNEDFAYKYFIIHFNYTHRSFVKGKITAEK